MGILGDIMRRDLTGEKSKEKILRPETLKELREIVWDEIKRQGKNVDLRHVEIPRGLKNMDYLFSNQPAVESLDLTGWDMADVRIFTRMFNGCENLKQIKGMGEWNVDGAYDFYEMFNECMKLETIDLSGWKIDFEHPLLTVDGMFAGCTNLKLIKGMAHWILSQEKWREIRNGCPGFIELSGEVKHK